MQSIVRKVDYQGRITIPKPFINALNLEPEDEITLTIDDAGTLVYMETLKNHCVFCGNEATLTFNNKPICQDCVARIKNN